MAKLALNHYTEKADEFVWGENKSRKTQSRDVACKEFKLPSNANSIKHFTKFKMGSPKQIHRQLDLNIVEYTEADKAEHNKELDRVTKAN